MASCPGETKPLNTQALMDIWQASETAKSSLDTSLILSWIVSLCVQLSCDGEKCVNVVCANASFSQIHTPTHAHTNNIIASYVSEQLLGNVYKYLSFKLFVNLVTHTIK